MVDKKGGNENQFRDFLRRNGIILLLIVISFSILGGLLVYKKNKKLENKKKSIISKEYLIRNKDILVQKKKNLEKSIKKFNCNDILKSGKNKSGIYDINIRGKEEKIKVYCDMKTSGGGWTLILTSREGGWSLNDVKSKNSNNVSFNFNYSILEKADLIKTIKDGKFKYKIDANKIGENGGVWEAPEEYSFISTSRFNTEVNLIEKYGNWKYYTFGIEKRMPYLCDAKYALLTTSINCNSKWFGTLVAGTKNFSPAPWIHSTMKNPGVIRYWVK